MTKDSIEKNKLRHELILSVEKLIEITNKFPDEFQDLRKNLLKGLECFVNKVYEIEND